MLFQVPSDGAGLEELHDRGGRVLDQQAGGRPDEEGGDGPGEAAPPVRQSVQRQLLGQRLLLQSGRGDTAGLIKKKK